MTYTTIGKLHRDCEDDFTPPPVYDGGAVVDRYRFAIGKRPEIDRSGAERVLARRRERDPGLQRLIDRARTSPHSDPELVAELADVDVFDLAAQTPWQAALVAAVIRAGGYSDAADAPVSEDAGAVAEVEIWECARDLAFALEAFAHFCHLACAPGAVRLRRAEQAPMLLDVWPHLRRLLELRRRVPGPDHVDAKSAAARLREDDPTGFHRTLTGFLFPEQGDWGRDDREAAIQGLIPAIALLPGIRSAEHASALGPAFREQSWEWYGDLDIELTLLTYVGSGALPFLLAWLDGGHRCEPGGPCAVHDRVLELVARIPNAEAISALLERSGDARVLPRLREAVARFPRRALRVLAEVDPAGAETGEIATTVLTEVVHADPEFARAEQAYLSPGGEKRVSALLPDDPDNAALLSQLPVILAAPPWRDRKRKPAKLITVDGLVPPSDAEAVWEPGERERWLCPQDAGWAPQEGWSGLLRQIAEGTADEPTALYFAAHGPDELVRPLLTQGWRPVIKSDEDRVLAFVARYETLALPAILGIERRPALRARLLLPFANREIAALMVDGVGRLRSVHGAATTWLRRHPEAAARCVLPTALGKRGKARRGAEAMLRSVEAAGVDVPAIATRTYGTEVGQAVKELLADDGLGAVPRTMPQPPPAARAALLAPIRLRDGRTAVPQSAAQAVVDMLTISTPDEPYAGLEIVKAACDAGSLAEFAWSLYTAARETGLPALRAFGDESIVERLLPVLRERNEIGESTVGDEFQVLAAIGGDRALTTLHTYSVKGRHALTRKTAQEQFDAAAEAMDLSALALADRVVPDLGLGPDGTLGLDYGPRRFVVGFDELLRPVVCDEAGDPLKALPKPGKNDDSELADAAYKKFTELKKTARTVALDQIKRLGSAMRGRRRWDPEDFATYLVAHPVMRHLVRRLVWGVYDEQQNVLGSFRVAEDLSYADVHDAGYVIPSDAKVRIGVAHPADLGTTLGDWSELFADYEILQPFEQLGWPIPALTDRDRTSKLLDRPYVTPDPTHISSLSPQSAISAWAIVWLQSRGWQRGPLQAGSLADGPRWRRTLRPVGGDRHVVLELEPGILAGAPGQSEHQYVTAVWLSGTGANPEFDRDALPWSELDEATAAQVLRELEEMV
ncbi:DUF4132 domain-containing protein [Catenulispora sp. NF23]|uniref:DUF4132 domain-containing protein n=1 Tax=Catenulispora pinistramenti TaxID=2705254 RepID=UPI001BA4F5B9|nr:DUF4132 domain-containing protein [Catenulispora pinistramenti]MBS2532547.1 DUF4132 domain-containing protein [Catenulispora pinistramenti]